MKITKDNLNEVMFENHDARLLIEDVVTRTSANLYYYHNIEITVQKALEIWYKAQAADEEDDMIGQYSVSFLDFPRIKYRNYYAHKMGTRERFPIISTTNRTYILL